MALQDRACRLDGDRRRLIEQVLVQVAGWRRELGRRALAPKVLAALARVPREDFVLERQRHLAWQDTALDLACGQRISQPSIVAAMTDLLAPEPRHRVLEIGTGCGYQTAVLSQLAGEVFSVELEEELALGAIARLTRLGCTNVAVRIGDGRSGWAKHAPFDRVIVTAAAAAPPPALLTQLARGGRMVLPLGDAGDRFPQRLVALDKLRDGRIRRRDLLPVRFVPLRPEPTIRFKR